ncbi:hypothetical protein Bca4012_040605 [Brassica carinata]|uniref:Uncharacterized protein n=1 Tax=Brassica carinata TaxID=52824 RepID=A0A8X7V1I9_BRACI|nr:hypothetical protein Bca52824_044345 [Brassica carinata]
MCKKISEYRQTTLPDHHLRNTALSSSHTSNIDSGSDPLPSSKPLTYLSRFILSTFTTLPSYDYLSAL